MQLVYVNNHNYKTILSVFYYKYKPIEVKFYMYFYQKIYNISCLQISNLF